MERTGEIGPRIRVAAWAALVLGVLHAAVSASWALGGTAGLDLLGGRLAAMARATGPLTAVALWAVVALKVAAALPGVLTLRARSDSVRRLLLAGTWTVACFLVLYGGVLVAGQALVVTGVIPASPDADLTAIRGHLYLWDPWFLLWGLLLLVVAVGTTRWRSPGRRRGRSAGPPRRA